MKYPKKKMMMNKYSFLIAFFIVLTSFSQNYKGTLSVIKEDGLHKIILPQEVRSSCNENFNFLRIQDAQKNEVPYVLVYNNDKTFSTFKPIKIASKKVLKDSITSILFENKTRKTQDYITLQIANTKIIKRYTVYGSDDGKEWFGLVSNKSLSYLNKPQKTATGKVFIEKKISFPLNTYTFLRIDFNDKNSLPINILGAGVYESKFFTQTPIEIATYKQEIVSIKEKKITQLKFTATDNHSINVISFKINTDFFLRNAKLIVKKTRKVKKRVETYNQVISRFQLNSKSKNTFTFNNLNEKEFIIEIDNQDNPSLTIENVQLLQKPVYLITNLKQKQSYEVLINNMLSKPSYDLGNFISNKTPTIKEATILNFSEVEKKEEELTEKSFWETTLFMWICIVLGGVLVVYFAVSLVKDISNQEK
ncbi:hypothetical protein CXF68_05140 [Tenacibaculum sp. Bg11-29]|uniref:hypothetical protein n=1 Tax=Tenacibaculum sp. Bg11-29 TaxID=2058306 RepID=UPI000C340E0B|nr:hypothetical protein [Tenacibaculum sp. Bg11-29]PKH50124.1 hypothetical protein CXF68_05140 [Tenacibaculum sp. Bg11-29]